MNMLYGGFLKIFERINEGKRYEVMDRGNSINVLVVKPGDSFETDQFYIGNQYRAGADQYMFTAVAGMIDPGESGSEAATREAMEEAGISGKMYYLSGGYTSPGGCTEYTDQFLMFPDKFEEPTDKSEGIVWTWFTGKQLLERSSGTTGFFNSMQLNHAIVSYLLRRDYFMSLYAGDK